MKRWKNFKAMPLSVARRHQRRMCLYQATSAGIRNENYLHSADDVKSGQHAVLQGQPAMNTPEIAMHSHTYRVGTILLKKWVDDEMPVFISVEQILTFNDEKYVSALSSKLTSTDILMHSK